MILIKADESQECLYERGRLAHALSNMNPLRVNVLSINICSNAAPVTARTEYVFVGSTSAEGSEVRCGKRGAHSAWV